LDNLDVAEQGMIPCRLRLNFFYSNLHGTCFISVLFFLFFLMKRSVLDEFESTIPDWASDNSQSDSADNDENGAREHYVDVSESKLRKNLELELDPKYEGIPVQRKELQEEEEDFEQDFGALDEHFAGLETDSEEEFEESAEEELEDQQGSEYEESDVLKSISRPSVSNAEQGLAIRNQLNMWDGLLDLRIRVQKLLESSNSLPSRELYSKIQDSKVEECVANANENLFLIFDELMNLQMVIWH
jgi:protein AATF/BFR2